MDGAYESGKVLVLGSIWLLFQITYYTEYFAEVIFNGDPNAEVGSELRNLYEEGIRYGSIGLFLQNVVGIICAFYAEDIIKMMGRRNAFVYSCVRALFMDHSLWLSLDFILIRCSDYFRFSISSNRHLRYVVDWFFARSSSSPSLFSFIPVPQRSQEQRKSFADLLWRDNCIIQGRWRG